MKYVWGLTKEGLLERAEMLDYHREQITEELVDTVREAILNSSIPEVLDDVIYSVLSRNLGALDREELP